MGLDVGSRTVGVAVSDLMGWTAQGVETIRINEDEGDFGFDRLLVLIKEQSVNKVIIGLPKNMNNSIGPRAEASLAYGEKLQELLPEIEIAYQDERLTTAQAEKMLITEGDVSRKKRKQVIDKLAAVIILQNYLNTKN
ncbi:Holliday junction resolvase RuvX [Fundicoccus ignavus]|uniref:Putative pre-16S rRNA nuclease n=1 Tax=Fundicoccus ignavus TaxID=2664442 RepID=A0A6I2GFE8_9LACT|nr:Holliday junction resolvase RuvX [Fundicoccus ignavus]MRI81429.1 Holliday junction resolvase RuvX [Fundicoccus ignavus]MRI85414.1 Holliday junction resolvase RuvX [Fundicoccus ignavus]MRJ47491.1 Holliday junction resolvase RuvX [Fundicoccus ignavus]